MASQIYMNVVSGDKVCPATTKAVVLSAWLAISFCFAVDICGCSLYWLPASWRTDQG
jgi:hypothetical protein